MCISLLRSRFAMISKTLEMCKIGHSKYLGIVIMRRKIYDSPLHDRLASDTSARRGNVCCGENDCPLQRN